MLTGWEGVPAWHAIAQDWQRELGLAGVTPYRLVTSVDVHVADPAELAGLEDRPGAWLPKVALQDEASISWADLRRLLADTPDAGPAGDELAYHLARTGGDMELIAALMIRATCVGYLRGSPTDALQMIGDVAAARLEAEGIELSRQGQRPTFLLRGRLPYSITHYAHIITALAREHADILRHLRPVRFRAIVDGASPREAVTEERRGGLLVGLSALTDQRLKTVMEVEGFQPLDADGRPWKSRDLRTAEPHVQKAVRRAIIEAVVASGRNPEAYLDRGRLLFPAPVSAAVTSTTDHGYRVEIARSEPLALDKTRGFVAAVTVGLDGSLSEQDRKEVARIFDHADDLLRFLGEEPLRIDKWEQINRRDLRIDPLTRRLLSNVDIDPVEDVVYRWGDTCRDNESVPTSMKDIGALNLAVVDGNVIARRVAIPCSVQGGLLFLNDGRRQTVTLPRLYSNDVLDQELADVLGSRALKGLTGATVDFVAIDHRDWSVLHVRSRPRALVGGIL